MPQQIKLSDLIYEIGETLEERFSGGTFWVTAEITDLRRMPQKKWCFLRFIEKEGDSITACMDAVCWAKGYEAIRQFEKETQTTFENGLEVTCRVAVRFTARHGLKLEIMELDTAHLLGRLELERRRTLERLLLENGDLIRLEEGAYTTYNNRLPLPGVIKRIALITAVNSDGQRDFTKELQYNAQGYAFSITEFLTTVQGDTASALLLQQLHRIEAASDPFDLVVIARGGGSQADFKPFDNYELARYVALFPLPVLTGIGHDSNISIVDLMGRGYKTPTKVAGFIVEHNTAFDMEVEALRQRLQQGLAKRLERAGNELKELKRVVKTASPQTILARGFALVMVNGTLVTNPALIMEAGTMQTILKDTIIHSTVINKTRYEPGTEL